MSVADTAHVYGDGKMCGSFLQGWQAGRYDPPEGAAQILEHGHPFWSAILFRKEALDSLGGIKTETGALIDLELTLRMALAHACIPRTAL